MKTQILLTIEQKAHIPDLLDKVAGRAYTLTGVDDVTAKLFYEEETEDVPTVGSIALFE